MPLWLEDHVEQIAREDDEEGYRSEENSDQSPGHHFLEQGRLGQRESYDGHHEGNGSAQGNTFGHKYFNYRDNTGGIGIVFLLFDDFLTISDIDSFSCLCII